MCFGRGTVLHLSIVVLNAVIEEISMRGEMLYQFLEKPLLGEFVSDYVVGLNIGSGLRHSYPGTSIMADSL